MKKQADIGNFFKKRSLGGQNEGVGHSKLHTEDDFSAIKEDDIWHDEPDITESSSDESDIETASHLLHTSEGHTTTSLISVKQKPLGPRDISNGRAEEPTQPERNFPSRDIGGKRRSFRSQWYESHPWLEYSISRDAAFCFCCRLFSVPNKVLPETTFTSGGFRQWKKATEKDAGFAQHERSDYHKLSYCAWKEFKEHLNTGKTIEIALTSAHQKKISDNRHYVKQIAKVLRLTATQKIAQRGHKEGENSSNRGNFIEILELLSENDEILKAHLKGPSRVKYLSPKIQKEILELMAQMVREEISKELAYSKQYSVMIDESKDVSQKEQLSIVVRYVYLNCIHEEFLAFSRLHELNAGYLKDKLAEMLRVCGIDTKDCVGQTYDGASVMSGVNRGVQTLFREEFAPQAVYIHCFNHRLNLVIVESVKCVRLADSFFCVLEKMYVFMSSHTPHEIFLKEQELLVAGCQPRKLKKLSDTRWSCQYMSCKVLLDTLPAVISTLKKISTIHTGKKCDDARGILMNIDFGFVTCLVMFNHILQKTKLLSDMLQSPMLDLSAAADLVQTVEEDLAEERNEAQWHILWGRAEKVANDVGIEINPKRRTGRQTQLPPHLTDSVVMETTGQRESLNEEQDYCIRLYYPVMDCLLGEIGARFDESNKLLMKSLTALDPCNSKFLDVKQLKPMAEQYSIDLTYLEVELCQAKRLVQSKTAEGVSIINMVQLAEFMNPYKDAFPDLWKLINIGLVLPPTSASCERSFSSMRQIKTYLRNSMHDDKLASVAVLGIHPQRAKLIDMDKIVSLFAHKHNNRKIQLF